jgi:hypothetical protein
MRQVRGRIVDELRRRPTATIEELSAAGPRPLVRRAVRALETDGILRLEAGRASLQA